MEAFILLSGWFLVLPSFSCWDGFLVSLLESPSISSPFSSPFFVLRLKNDGETGPWWEPKLPVVEGDSAQITTKFFSRVPVEVSILIFFFSFWLGILIELCVAAITTGSPLLSPGHTPLNFLLNQYHLVSMRRERLQILYIKVGIEKFLWLAPGQHPIHSIL